MEGRHHSAPQLSIPTEVTARTAKLLAAVLAVMPACCGGYEVALSSSAHGRAEKTTGDVLAYPDPFVLIMVMMFIVQALLFAWIGGCFPRRGQRALALRLEQTQEKLKKVELAHQQFCARTGAQAAMKMPERIFLTTTGDRAHLSTTRCSTLRHSVNLKEIVVCHHCQRLGPDTGP